MYKTSNQIRNANKLISVINLILSKDLILSIGHRFESVDILKYAKFLFFFNCLDKFSVFVRWPGYMTTLLQNASTFIIVLFYSLNVFLSRIFSIKLYLSWCQIPKLTIKLSLNSIIFKIIIYNILKCLI